MPSASSAIFCPSGSCSAKPHPDTWLHYDGRVYTASGFIDRLREMLENEVSHRHRLRDQANMKRPVVITINALLVLVIAGLITATWMPVIYTSQWFQTNHWVRSHLLHNESEGTAKSR